MRKIFVALQVALSSLLLIGAGLFARPLDNLRKVNLGFQTDNVVIFGVRPAVRFDEARKLQVFRTMLENLATIPGVKAVGANSTLLLTGGCWDTHAYQAARTLNDQGTDRRDESRHSGLGPLL